MLFNVHSITFSSIAVALSVVSDVFCIDVGVIVNVTKHPNKMIVTNGQNNNADNIASWLLFDCFCNEVEIWLTILVDCWINLEKIRKSVRIMSHQSNLNFHWITTKNVL